MENTAGGRRGRLRSVDRNRIMARRAITMIIAITATARTIPTGRTWTTGGSGWDTTKAATTGAFIKIVPGSTAVSKAASARSIAGDSLEAIAAVFDSAAGTGR